MGDDWAPSSEEDMNVFNEIVLKRLIREPEACEYIKYVIGSSLSGRNKTCDFIVNHHGKGSNGKSTLLEFIAHTLTDCYARKIPNDTFDTDAKANRTYSTLTPNIRFMICEDITTNVKKTSFLKVCVGEVTVAKLYLGGSFDMEVNGKLFITTNHMLTFDTNDFGIQRRLNYYDYKNRFVETDIEVNEEIGHYKKVYKDFKLLGITEKLIFFNIIAPYTSLFYQNTSIPKPDSVLDCNSLPNWEMFVNQFLYQDSHGKARKSKVFGLAVSSNLCKLLKRL